MARATSGGRKYVLLVLLISLLAGTANAAGRQSQRRGKVIVIRGAFTVFSLGLNELGKKLAHRGLDVDVIADVSAGRVTSQLVAAYRRNRNIGPIIFVGHSRGAQLAPEQARTLQRYKIPVDLIVMVDNVHPTTIPSNVKRCVNLYQSNTLGVLDGEPARVDSRRTELINKDIDQLQSRRRGGMINHFNIDSSPWIHDLVVAEVLKVCPAKGAQNESSANSRGMASRRSNGQTTRSGSRVSTQQKAAPDVTTNSVRLPRPRSASGLTYPRTVIGGLRPPPAPSRARSQDKPSPDARTAPKARSSRAKSDDRSKTALSLGSRDASATRKPTRTARRPDAKGKVKSSPSASSDQPETTSGKQPAASSDASPESLEKSATKTITDDKSDEKGAQGKVKG